MRPIVGGNLKMTRAVFRIAEAQSKLMFGAFIVLSLMEILTEKSDPSSTFNGYKFVHPYCESDGDKFNCGKQDYSEDSEESNYPWIQQFVLASMLMVNVPLIIWYSIENNEVSAVVEELSYADQFEMYEKETEQSDHESGISTNGEINEWQSDIVYDVAYSLYLKMKAEAYQPWALKLIGCEFLKIFNLILRVWISNIFFNYHYLFLGFNPDKRHAMISKENDCAYYQSTQVDVTYAFDFCKEKAALSLWFIDFLQFIIFLLTFFVRYTQITFHRSILFNRIIFNRPKSMAVTKWLSKQSYSNWLFLKYLSEHIRPERFSLLLSALNVAPFKLEITDDLLYED